MSVNEKMTAIADAIREKTGGTELLGLDAMAQAIVALGGGTPDSIDKIDGGLFTMASTHSSGNYEIPHNLGEYPDFFMIRNVSVDDTSITLNRSLRYYLICYGRSESSAGTVDGTRTRAGNPYHSTSIIGVSSISNYFDNNKIIINYAYDANLIKGHTYAWVAIKFKRVIT